MYDLIIIGAGAAGLMAANIAQDNGLKYIILERNSRAGRKIALTGKGRCNITNNNQDLQDLVSEYSKNGKFLYGTFSQFSVKDTLEYFEKVLDLELKTERGNRVFPNSDKAIDVVYALTKRIKDRIIYNTDVIDFKINGNSIESVITNNGEYKGKHYLLATGGMSYPTTGSNGDGYKLARKLGHTIVEPKPALVPITVKEQWVKELSGLSLKNVNISVIQNGKKHISKFGEALFTHEGMSGPIIIDMSREIGDLLEKAPVELSIDFKPALNESVLDNRVIEDFKEFRNKAFRNSLNKLLPSSLIPVFLALLPIDKDKKVADINKEERKSLVKLLKDFRLNVKELDSWDKAIVTAGGIDIKEIEPKTMKSKIINNLYFAGEIIDVYGPTGGYNLQICWSTAKTVNLGLPK